MLTVFGSIIVDNVFSMPSLPRPGETVLADDLFVGPGGKGANQAVAAAKVGAEVSIVGSVGSDAAAQISMTGFEAAGVGISGVQTVAGPTGSAAVMVDAGGANAISVASAANRQTSASQLTPAIWDQTSTLLMQMEIPLGEIDAAIAEARKRGIRSILNLAPAAPLDPQAFRALDVLIVNEVELEMLASFLGLAADTHEAMARATAGKLDITLVATLGDKGALCVSGGSILFAPALAIDPADTTGAGDAFCGVFAASLDAGLSLEDALRRSCVAGSLACLKTGAQKSLPTADDLNRYL